MATSGYDQFNGINGSRIGFWDVGYEGEAMTWKLDLDAFLADVRSRMVAVEEKITRKLVVEKLRELGYTIIEPEEVDHG